MRKIISTGKYAIMTVLILFLTFLITGNAAKAEVAKHENLWHNYYTRTLSFITPTSDGGYMIFDAGSSYRSSEGYLVEYYDSNYNFVKSRIIAVELPLFGGFYSDGSNYYLVTGQENPEESASVEVYRVTKYNTSWTRQGAASLKDCNTTVPFDAGRVDMASAGGKLFIRTCHEMYKSSDGKNHQANLTMLVNTANMTMLDSHYWVSNWGFGYCSHSFSQMAALDGNNFIGADLGDGHPRGILVTRYNNAVSSGSLSDMDVFLPYSFSGKYGDNYTGATIGNLSVSSSSYLVSASSIQQDVSGSTTQNILIATVNKSTGETGTQWITSNPEGDLDCVTPFLIKINDNRFLVLWNKGNIWEVGKIFQYAFVDGTGALQGSIYSASGFLSDCRPILHGNKVVWYTFDGYQTNFFEINTTTGEFTSKYPVIQAQYSITSSDATITFGNISTTYTGEPFTPKVNVKYGDKVLTEGVDYIVTYTNNVEVGTGLIRIRGINLYSGSAVRGLYINAASIHSQTIELSETTFTYTGKEIKPTITVKNGDKILKEGTDYELTYEDNIEVGSGIVYIKGIGNYDGTSTKYFTINAKAINSAITVQTEEEKIYYTGSELTPKMIVKDGSVVLTEGKDYSLSYSDNTAIGVGKVTVTGLGNYTGTYNSTFEILSYVQKVNLEQVAEGVKISWEARPIAAKYRVMRKEAGGKFAPLAKVTATTYVDKTVEAGKTYIYTVRCIDASGSYVGDYDTVGETVTLEASTAPQVVLTETADGYVKVTWDAIPDAVKYRVLRKAEGETKFSPLAKVSSTSYTDKTVEAGKTYTYTVRCMDGAGVYFGDYDKAGKSITLSVKVAGPEVTVSNTDAGVLVTWTTVPDAAKYRVLRKAEGETVFTPLAKVSGTSYTDKNVEKGKTYFYTVRPMNSEGKYFGEYDTTGKNIVYSGGQPEAVVSANWNSGVVIVTWEAVEGAAKYRVLRKEKGGTEWTPIAKTAKTTYTDKNVVSGTEYYYTVRLMNADGKYFGTYDKDGVKAVEEK